MTVIAYIIFLIGYVYEDSDSLLIINDRIVIKFINSNKEVDLSDLQNGIYFVRIPKINKLIKLILIK